MARRVYSVATLAVALAVMFLAWPASLGGSTRYVVTSGISMEPLFHSGDLAILRPAGQYRVGDIAGYHSPTLHATVLHRIVERRGDRYLFKGDHNTWRDGDYTRRADILGRLRVRIPHGGLALRLISRPAVLIFAGGLVTMAGSKARRRRRARRARSPSSPGPLNPPSRLDVLSDHLRRPPSWAPSAATGVGALALMLAALAWTLPARVERAQPLRFEQRATLSYQARVAPEAVYPSGMLQLPDPVFLRLVPALDLDIGYHAGQVLAGRGQGLGGSYAVFADLHGGNNWARRFTLQPE